VIGEVRDGVIRVDGIENVPEIVPDVVREFTEIDQKLAEKQEKTSRLIVVAKNETRR